MTTPLRKYSLCIPNKGATLCSGFLKSTGMFSGDSKASTEVEVRQKFGELQKQGKLPPNTGYDLSTWDSNTITVTKTRSKGQDEDTEFAYQWRIGPPAGPAPGPAPGPEFGGKSRRRRKGRKSKRTRRTLRRGGSRRHRARK